MRLLSKHSTSQQNVGMNMDLDCILCGKKFNINELFLACIRDDNEVVLCECLDCAENAGGEARKPKKGYSWVVVHRSLDGDVIPNTNYEIV